jgi:RNA polymerase sigma-70 factor, ECF subfamily
MAVVDVGVALWHLLFLAIAIVIKKHGQFGAKRLLPVELVAQMKLVRHLIGRSLRGTGATKEDIKDLTQDVLLAAWEASEEDRYRPDPDAHPGRALHAWLWGLICHHVSHHLESARIRREELVAAPPGIADERQSAQLALEDEEARLAVLEALLQLPDGALIIAHDFAEIPMAEIEAQVNVPQSTLYKRRMRTIAALVEALRKFSG